MRFELGFEKKAREQQKANGEKLKGFADYEDFNEKPVDELLEKRRKEQEEFELRQKERVEKLKGMEKDGTLFIKE